MTPTHRCHPAVVVGLDCITGLQTARLLAARGVPVHGVAGDAGHFACRTRVVGGLSVAPTSGPGLLEALSDLAGRWDAEPVVFPCTDASVATLAHTTVPGYRIVLPPAGTVDRLASKVAFARHARAHRLPVPRTVAVRGEDDLDAALGLSFPCVVKPAVKSTRWERLVGGKVATFSSPSALREEYPRLASAAARELVVQEWVPGGEDRLFSCNFHVARDGTTTSFVARKLRQWPRHHGTSSLGESVTEHEVVDLTRRLLDTVPYRGLGYLELKRDPRTDRWLIIEPNIGRPTGRSALAEACGVQLLMSQYADSLEEPLPLAGTQRDGVKWIYLRHDLQSAAAAIRERELTVGGWLRSLHGPRVFAVWSARDPMPFVADLGRSARRVAATARRAPQEAVA
jgi:D-aspartate ligase